MPEVPDRSLSSPAPAAPQGGQNGNAPADPKAAESSKPPKQGPSPYEQRIEQLVREKYEFKSKFEQAHARLEDLAREVESLKVSRTETPRPSGIPSSVNEFTDQDLHQVIKAGSDASPDGFILAIQELQRRAAEKATKGVSEQTERRLQLERERQEVRMQVTQQFGPQAWNKSSDLFQAADAIYGQMLQEAEAKFGKGHGAAYINSMPSLQQRCFELADRELRANELAELPELRRSRDRLKQVEALQSGIGAPVQRDAAFQEALKRRDRKAIFENLPIVKGINP